MTFLVVGFSIGMAKLAEQHGFLVNNSLGSYISVHPILMVFGVIGGLLIAEKIEIMGRFLILRRLPISYPILVTMLTGIVLLSSGYAVGFTILRYAGTALIVTAGLLFLWFMVSRRNPGNTWVKLIMGSAIAAFSIASIAESMISATKSPAVALLLLSFPILYILGERIELGLMRNIRKNTMKLLGFSSTVIPFLLFVSYFYGSTLAGRTLFDAATVFFLIMILTSIKFDPSTRKMKVYGKLQSFMQSGIISSYVWLLTGIFLYLVQVNVERGFMDPATHSIALGFIGLFIIAHSPIIFPLTLKMKADTNHVTKLPIYAMNIAVFLRVGGDLISMRYEVGNLMAYSSVYILIIAIFLFFFNILRIRTSSETEAKGMMGNMT
ncbi:MAG: hypothetical protein QXN26_03270 [Thermoplasmataceae archaeon]